MISLYFHVAFYLHGLLQRHAPTNILVRAVRAGTGPPWLPVAALLGGVGYLFATVISIHVVEHDGPGWVNILVLVFAWNALKLGPVGGLALAQQVFASLWRSGYPTSRCTLHEVGRAGRPTHAALAPRERVVRFRQ